MIATIENMQKHYKDGVFAFSSRTGEEYSANPADYWDASDGWVMKDGEGEPMRLVRRRVCYVPVDA